MTQLPDKLLNRFMCAFLGYGSTKGGVWLVGMEEGGGDTVLKVSRRLGVWQQGGEPETEDLRLAHESRGERGRFIEHCRLQPTWAKLIRFLLARGGTTRVTTEKVRTYQRNQLGRLAGDHCLLELLPLPAKSRRHWHYDKWSTLPVLRNRAVYEEEIGRQRVSILKTKLKDLQPEFVLFYGLGYQNYWELLAGSAFETVAFEHQRFLFTKQARVRFAIVPHPTAHGATNALFETVGRYAAREC